MPRSRSMSIESSTCEVISRASSAPQRSISRSASVDLPWSMCATMAKLRMRERSVMESCARARGAPAMCGSVGLAPSLGHVTITVDHARDRDPVATWYIEDDVRVADEAAHVLRQLGAQRPGKRSPSVDRAALPDGGDEREGSLAAALTLHPAVDSAQIPLRLRSIDDLRCFRHRGSVIVQGRTPRRRDLREQRVVQLPNPAGLDVGHTL